MTMLSQEEMEMLVELGYNGDWMENISEGDEIAFHNMGGYRDGEEKIKFVTVAQLEKIPRISEAGHVDYLMKFIGVHANGLREPMTFGSGWGIFTKAV